MTTPAPSPQKPQEAKSGPSGKAIIGWGAGMLLFLGLAWCVGTIAVPVWRARKAIAIAQSNPRGLSWDQIIEQLGGPDAAAHCLGMYLRCPKRIAPRRWEATLMLGECGPPAVPVFLSFVRDKDGQRRLEAVTGLGITRDPRAVEPLIAALEDSDRHVRASAATWLGEIGDARAARGLRVALEDDDVSVRLFAASALEKIKARREEK